jgi:uncharacterized protein YutE (UPF0331/DUF86 family)
MDSKEKLMKIKNEGIFTAGQSFDQFVSDLCKRYSRIYGEILPIKDYDYIVMKLEEKGILDDEDEDDKPSIKRPV